MEQGVIPTEEVSLPAGVDLPDGDELAVLAGLVPHVVWTGDAAGACTGVSAPWRTLTGRAPATALGDGWLDAMAEGDRDRVRAAWAVARRLGHPLDEEARLGAGVAARLRLRPVRGPDGRPRRWVGTLAEAQEGGRLGRDVLDHLFTFVGVLTVDGTLVEANRAPLEAGGLCAEDVLNRKFWDCAWWTHEEGVRRELRAACARAAGGDTVRYDVPIRVVGDGRMWIDLQIAPARDARGNVTHLVACAVDVSARRAANTALKASEDRYHSTLARMDEGFALIGATRDEGGVVVDRVLLEANAAFERLTGLRATIGRRPGELAPLSPERSDGLRRVLEGGLSERFDVELAGRWFDVYANPVGAAPCTELALVFHDLTERRRAEAALRESEARAHAAAAQAEAERGTLDALLDAVPVGIMMAGKGGEILRMNPASLRVWGPAPGLGSVAGYAQGRGWWAAGTPRAGQPIEADEWALSRALRGEPARDDLVEIEPFDAPGTRRTMVSSGASVRDAEGNIVGAVIAQMDVTDRVRAEEQLRERERRLSYTLEATRAVAWTVLPGSDRMQLSETAPQVLGLPVDATLHEFSAILHPGDRERVREGSARALAGEAPYEFEFRIVRPDTHAVRWLFDRGIVERDAAGVLVRLSGLITDVTERRMAEEQAQAAQRMEAIGRLAGGVAHEINNALAAVLGFASLAQRRLPEASPARGHVEQIRLGAERAAHVTRQLLAFGRKQVLESRDVDVAAVVGTVEPMLRQALGPDKELRLLLPAVPAMAHVDSVQIEQVLLNLALNARDAMGYGGRLELEVTVDAAPPLPEKGPWVCLRVTDDGQGMTEDVRAHIFEPFFTTKPLGQGTGLGLATVYGIVKQSNGHIQVHTAPDEGTTFRIWLPLVGDSAAAQVRPPSSRRARPLRAGHVLVVDDDPLALRAVTAMLADQGYRVDSASSVAEAVEKARHTLWDLVVSDLIMPNESGTELARRLATTHPGLPVLMISGYPGAEATRRGLLPVGAPLLQKPFTLEELVAAVDRLVAGR